MKRNVKIHVDPQALLHNVRRIRNYAPDSKILAMVKANAYGHGAKQVSAILAEAVDAFGVAYVEEGAALRASGLTKPIVVMAGFNDSEELAGCAAHQLDIVVHQLWQIDLLEQSNAHGVFNIWLKIDSGMHRLGVLPQEFAIALERLQALTNVGQIRLMSHFGCASERTNDKTNQQITLYHNIIGDTALERSLANSAAVIAWPDSHHEWVRPGIMLYGVSPFSDYTAEELDLRPVMTASSKIIAVRRCLAGDEIGYGAAYRCPEDMPVAVVAVGYGDGCYPRQVLQAIPVLINQRPAQVLGRVSMDSIVVDLRQHQGVNVGDEVMLWGPGLPVEHIAKLSGRSAYELLCLAGNSIFAYHI
ncbi:MAG: alanine racemase [Gammaproteobacteria bacterium]